MTEASKRAQQKYREKNKEKLNEYNANRAKVIEIKRKKSI